VAIARFVMRNRKYTAAIRAENSRLIMCTLVYADEVVPADDSFVEAATSQPLERCLR
jgi:non-homologous end joining protein Ku